MLKYKMLKDKIDKLKFAFITIRYHPVDIESFNFFYNNIFLPIIKKSVIYCGTTEYDKILDKHLHFVIGYDNNFCKSSDCGKVRQKLNGTKIKNMLTQIYNTKEEHSIEVKPLDGELKSIEVHTTIGYCLKQAEYDKLETNLSEEELKICYEAYIYKEKKPICELEHNIEYKIMSKGNLLSYMYNSFIKAKFSIHQLVNLEAYMIQHDKISFIGISKNDKLQALKELKLKTSEKKYEYENCEYNTEDFYKIDEYEDIPKNQLIQRIKQLEEKLEYYES